MPSLRGQVGCYLYPVMYSVDDGVIIIDGLCPMGETVSEHELRTKGRILVDLLKTIEDERAPVSGVQGLEEIVRNTW